MARPSAPTPPRPVLDALIERARHRTMTPEEIFEQRVSFVHGNLAIDNPDVTREMVREVALAELPDKRLLAAKRIDGSDDWMDDDWAES